MSIDRFFKPKVEEKASATSLKRLEPAFYAKKPVTIQYAERPDAPYVAIPTAQFAAERKFEWTESMELPPELRDALWQDKLHPKLSATKIEERLHNPLDLVIIKVNDAMGEGLALSKESKAIPAGTIITLYAGAVEDSLTPSTNNYTMPIAEDEQKASVIADRLRRPRVNGSEHRGFGAYVLDTASTKEIQESTLEPTALSNVLEENCTRLPVIYKGCPVQVFISLRDIQPGELITSAYEGTIWSDGAKRCVLNKKLETVGHFNKGQIELDPNYKPTPEMAAPRMSSTDTEAVKVTFKELYHNTSVDKFDYKLRFIADIKTALDNFAGRFVKNSDEEKFVTRLQLAFNTAITAGSTDLAYKAAQEIFNDKTEFAKVKVALAPLKAEVIFHMTKYNEGIRSSKKAMELKLSTPPSRLSR